MKRPYVTVRPHDDVVRNRVYALLDSCGLAPGGLVPTGTADSEAVRAVIRTQHDILLVPFHGHTDESGDSLDGLAFLEKLAYGSPTFRWKVIMPVSPFAIASIRLRQGSIREVPWDRLFLLSIDRLDDPSIEAELSAFVDNDSMQVTPSRRSESR